MAKYTKQSAVSGAWLKAAEVQAGARAKLVSETTPQPSSFTNKDGSPKTQDVAKIRIEGLSETFNVSLNRATIFGLVDAFGEDSKDWQGHVLSVETEKVRVGGVTRTALYLIPDGYVKSDDSSGYAVITKKGEPLPTIQTVEEDTVDVSSIPF